MFSLIVPSETLVADVSIFPGSGVLRVQGMKSPILEDELKKFREYGKKLAVQMKDLFVVSSLIKDGAVQVEALGAEDSRKI